MGFKGKKKIQEEGCQENGQFFPERVLPKSSAKKLIVGVLELLLPQKELAQGGGFL